MSSTLQLKQAILTSVEGRPDGDLVGSQIELTSITDSGTDSAAMPAVVLTSVLDTTSVDDSAMGTGQVLLTELIGVGSDDHDATPLQGLSQAIMLTLIDSGPEDLLSLQPDGIAVRGAVIRNARLRGGSRGNRPVDPLNDPLDQRSAVGSKQPVIAAQVNPPLPSEYDAYRVVIRKSATNEDSGHELWNGRTTVPCLIDHVAFMAPGETSPVQNRATGGHARTTTQTMLTDGGTMTSADDLFAAPAEGQTQKSYSFDPALGYPKVVDFVFPSAAHPIDRVEITSSRNYGAQAPSQFDVQRYDRVKGYWHTITRSPSQMYYGSYTTTLAVNPDHDFLDNPHRYWRIAYDGSIDKLQFRQAPGVVEFPTSGSLIIDDHASGDAVSLFKVTPPSSLSPGSSAIRPFHVGWRYNTPIRVVEVAIRVPDRGALDRFDIEASDDGVTWWTVYVVPNLQRGWDDTYRVFTFPATIALGPV